jgi:hypothetical protein
VKGASKIAAGLLLTNIQPFTIAKPGAWIQSSVMKPDIHNSSFKTRSEAELVDAALEKGLPFGEGIAVVLREPKMPTGFPDIVAVFADANADSFTVNRRKLTQQHFRLLYHLHNSGRSKMDDVAKLLLLPRKHVAELVDDLLNADLISTRGSFVTARPLGKIFAARHIIAVEAKIKNWRKALQQAVANLWFASHSYILLPPPPDFEPRCERGKEIWCRGAGF